MDGWMLGVARYQRFYTKFRVLCLLLLVTLSLLAINRLLLLSISGVALFGIKHSYYLKMEVQVTTETSCSCIRYASNKDII